MSSDVVTWKPDDATYWKAVALLKLLQAAGPKAVMQELNWAVTLWQREIKRHMPVDQGIARNSVDIAPAVHNLFDIAAEVGSNVPYVPFLEFNENGRIAGGQLKAWQPGDAPILDWPAKRGEATKRTVVSQTPWGQGRNTRGQFASVRSTNAAEFMPPFRGSWQLIADQVVNRLRSRVADLMRQGKLGNG